MALRTLCGNQTQGLCTKLHLQRFVCFIRNGVSISLQVVQAVLKLAVFLRQLPRMLEPQVCATGPGYPMSLEASPIPKLPRHFLGPSWIILCAP